jgi:hypothetical protein
MKQLKNIRAVLSRTIPMILFVIGSIILLACSSNQEDILEQQINNEFDKNISSHRLTAEAAIRNSLDFINNIGKVTRSTKAPLSVSEVKAIGYKNELTRSINDSINLDSLFYIVNFDNNEGFVIASSDDRETPVFA